jgi:hypothetical protein
MQSVEFVRQMLSASVDALMAICAICAHTGTGAMAYILCSRNNAQITFDRCHFIQCGVMVSAAAQVAVNGCHFLEADVALFATGCQTSITASSCIVSDCSEAFAASDHAQITAHGCMLSQCKANCCHAALSAVLRLSDCKVAGCHAFAAWAHGVASKVVVSSCQLESCARGSFWCEDGGVVQTEATSMIAASA